MAKAKRMVIQIKVQSKKQIRDVIRSSRKRIFALEGGSHDFETSGNA
jgi:hypothetical protein